MKKQKRKTKMKKMIAALSLVLTMGVANAASLNWVISGVNLPESTTPASGAAVYMFVTAATGNALGFSSGAELTTIDAVVASIQNGTFDGSGAYVSSVLSAAGGTTAATGVSTSFGAGDSLSAFAVIFDNADIADAKNFMIAENAAGNQVLSTSWTSSTGAKSLAWGSQATNGTEWQAVPEPTSGLLMLVGLAGLALRRRRA